MRCAARASMRSAPRSRAWRRIFGDRVHEIAKLGRCEAADRRGRTGWSSWYRPGLLLIGDAAHAMSPIGGVGINLAIQDAVAAANILCRALRQGAVTMDDLRAVQRRRELPTRMTQGCRLLIQNRVISNVLRASGPLALPLPLRLLERFPVLRRFPARVRRDGLPAGACPAASSAAGPPPSARWRYCSAMSPP